MSSVVIVNPVIAGTSFRSDASRFVRSDVLAESGKVLDLKQIPISDLRVDDEKNLLFLVIHKILMSQGIEHQVVNGGSWMQHVEGLCFRSIGEDNSGGHPQVRLGKFKLRILSVLDYFYGEFGFNRLSRSLAIIHKVQASSHVIKFLYWPEILGNFYPGSLIDSHGLTHRAPLEKGERGVNREHNQATDFSVKLNRLTSVFLFLLGSFLIGWRWWDAHYGNRAIWKCFAVVVTGFVLNVLTLSFWLSGR